MLRNQIDVLSARLTRKLRTGKKKRLKEVSRVHALYLGRETETGSPQCTGSPPSRILGRLKNEGLDPQLPNPVTWRPPTQLGTNERRRRRRRPH